MDIGGLGLAISAYPHRKHRCVLLVAQGVSSCTRALMKVGCALLPSSERFTSIISPP